MGTPGDQPIDRASDGGSNPPEEVRKSPAAQLGTLLLRLVVALVIVGSSLLAFVIALYVSCSFNARAGQIYLNFGAGIVAAALMGIGMASIFRWAGWREKW